jgi:hypothetical protein
MLEFFIDYQVFQQFIIIPMSTNWTPLLADPYMADSVWEGKKIPAVAFKFIDDV